MTTHFGRTGFDIDTNNSCNYEELEKHVARSSNDFTLIQQNIRGINSKIGDIKYLIENTYKSGHPDCILLCETWLGPHSPTVKIAGYNFVHTDRVDKKGGGVGILLSDRIKYRDRSDIRLDIQECDSCFLEVKTRNKPIIIGSIYRPPNSNVCEFVSKLEQLIKKINLEKNKYIIIGLDHNLDLLKSSIHKQTNDFTEMLLDNGMVPTITKPTRISKTTATLIDNILISEDLQEKFNSGILIDNSSDHLPCYATLKDVLLSKKAPLIITSRDTRPHCIKQLKEKLDIENWDPDDNLSTNENFNVFHSRLQDLVNQFLPVTHRRINAKAMRREPWMTQSIIKSTRKCKQLYHQTLKTNSLTSRERYTKYNAMLQKVKRHARQYYFTTKCRENKNNTKKLWQLINKTTGKINDKTSIIDYLNSDGVQLHNPEDITNIFGNYFATVGSRFADKIAKPSRNVDEYLRAIRSNEKSIFLQPTTPQEVQKLIQNLPNKRSSGYDGINNVILKEICDQISSPLSHIFNHSLTTGTFPDDMKTADVVPLYKGKSRYEVENYRPISLLITISKLLEKVVYRRVYDFLISSNQLYESQYGFRSNHACEHAVGEFISEVVKNNQLGKTTAGIFLDLSKAFDTLEHTVIFKKLETYGIRGKTLDWFKSYLNNRKLRMKCRTSSSSKESLSKLFNITMGTPQGSCLGSLIFLIFCNDLRLHLTHLQCIQFADDTTLFASHKSTRYLEYCITTDLETLHDWFRANKLTLNLEKSVLMMMGGKKHSSLDSIKIGSYKIKTEKVTKFLGVWIDSELTWKEHVNRLAIKLKSKLGLLRKSKNFLDPSSMKVLYYAQIYSNLSYCLSQWGNMITKAQMTKLSKIQEKCVETIDKNLTISDTFKTYKLLRFEDMITHKTNKLWQKQQLEILPTPLIRNMKTDVTGMDLEKTHRYDTRNKAYLNQPSADTKTYRNSFLAKGLKAYNSLPLKIRELRNTNTFNLLSKEHLLKTRL